MSSTRVKAPTGGRIKTSVHRSYDHRPSRSSKVLAERNQAVVAVGAWVEGGQEFPEHPAVLALETDALQAERRRAEEESLQRFQDGVRHRLAQQAQFSRRRREQPDREGAVTPGRKTPQQRFQVWCHMESAGASAASARRPMERSSMESAGGMRQVRLRLAACRVSQHEDAASDLPGGEWNVSPARHAAEGESGEDAPLYSPHECPLVQQKATGHTLWETDKSQPDSSFKSSLGGGVPPVLWPLTGQEELRRQRQSQFLMHRRLVMNSERERVKENKQQWRHLKKTARIKAEKEQLRQEEERRLEEARQREEARQKLEERELLILERLRLEEEERAEELQRRKRQEKGKVALRFVEALRAQLKERLSQAKLDLPPLCCCASSFWDSHPDTCANNCVFHNNPKAYAQALHSAVVSLNLQ